MTTNNLYTYAFLDTNSNVIATALFSSHDLELIGQTQTTFGATSFKSCEQYGECGIGSYFYNDAFYPPKPFASWVIDEESKNWKAPIEKPEDHKTYVWDEENVEWDLVIPAAPHASWIWDEDSWGWLPPVEYPQDGALYIWNETNTNWEEAE